MLPASKIAKGKMAHVPPQPDGSRAVPVNRHEPSEFGPQVLEKGTLTHDFKRRTLEFTRALGGQLA
jgi:hypothetical protein